LKVKNKKTGYNWDVKGKQMIELALNPDYEIISATKEELEEIEKLREKEPPTIQELVFDV
jgi:hypothetical protein